MSGPSGRRRLVSMLGVVTLLAALAASESNAEASSAHPGKRLTNEVPDSAGLSIDARDIYALVDNGPFAGVSDDNSTHTTTVHLAQALSTADSEALKQVVADPVTSAGWSFKTDQVARSYTTLQGVNDSLEQVGGSALTSQLVSHYVDDDTDTVHVGLLADDANLRATLDAAFPGDLSFAIERRPSRKSRVNDTSPFYAGGQTQQVGGDGVNHACTLGFFVIPNANTNQRRALSAGHCDNKVGIKVYNGNSTQQVGAVFNYDFSNHGWDTALIGGAFSINVFVGGVTNPSTKVVHGDHVPMPKSFVCSEGGFGGEYCAWQVIKAQDACEYFNDLIETCHMGIANGSDDVTDGDSGAPIVVNAGASYATGILIGTADTGEMCYHPIRDLESRWQVTLQTDVN